MIIAIEKDLEHIREYMKQETDYKVYIIGDYEGAVDVVIYDIHYTSEDFSQYQYKSIQDALGERTDISQGTLMINAQYKEPQQVIEIIKNQIRNNKKW